MISDRVHIHPARALPPGPRGYPFVGVLPHLLKDPLGTFTSAARRYGGVVRLGSHRPGGHVILISKPGVLTMFVAGHETTANTLAWTWYLLSLHPEVERLLHAEDEID